MPSFLAIMHAYQPAKITNVGEGDTGLNTGGGRLCAYKSRQLGPPKRDRSQRHSSDYCWLKADGIDFRNALCGPYVNGKGH